MTSAGRNARGVEEQEGEEEDEMDEHEDITPAAFREFNRSRTGSSSHSHGAPAPGLGPEPGPGLPPDAYDSQAGSTDPESVISRSTGMGISPVAVPLNIRRRALE